MDDDIREPGTFLSLPAEIRNLVYNHVYPHRPPLIAVYPDGVKPNEKDDLNTAQACSLGALCLVNRQLYNETILLHLSRTAFHLGAHSSNSSSSVTSLGSDSTKHPTNPSVFTSAHLRRLRTKTHETAIKHIVLHASIASLRNLNESWHGTPFGQPDLDLHTLTLVPARPETFPPHAQVADLSQLHTLAYLLCETVKSLRRVRVLRVANRGCFTTLLWRLAYRSLVYRLWKWAREEVAAGCGLGFREVVADGLFEVRCAGEGGGGVVDELGGDADGTLDDLEGCGWRDADDELDRLTGIGSMQVRS